MAAATGIAVNCYWNGQVKKENDDVIFEGDNMNVTPIKLEYGTTYAELLDKMYKITGIERQDFELNIMCRYPVSSREYKPIPVKNDEAVEVMLEVPSRSGVYCVEIYLEKKPSLVNLPRLIRKGNGVNKGYGLADKFESKNDNGESFIRPHRAGLLDICKPSSLSCSYGGKHGETSSKHLTDFARTPISCEDSEYVNEIFEDIEYEMNQTSCEDSEYMNEILEDIVYEMNQISCEDSEYVNEIFEDIEYEMNQSVVKTVNMG